MRYIKDGDFAIATDTYVKLGDNVWVDEAIEGVGMKPGSLAIYVFFRTPALPGPLGPYVVEYNPGDPAYGDATALYERRLAAATEESADETA